MNELSKYKYVANDFNDLCNIIGEIEEITLNHAVDFVTQPTLWYRGQCNIQCKRLILGCTPKNAFRILC